MPTPIRRRFQVDTLILDQVAQTPATQVTALLSDDPTLLGADRWRLLGADEWTDVITDTASVEYKWAQAFFGQALKPASAVFITRDKAGAETVEAALDDAVAQGVAFYLLNYVGNAAADISDQNDIATYIESFEEKVQFHALTNDPNAKDAGQTTDIGYQVRNQNLHRTGTIFHPTGTVNGVDLTDQRPDAAIAGRMITTDEGAEQWDYKALSLVSDTALTVSEQTALRDKGYNFVETFKNTTFTHLFPGRLSTDREIRVQWGADWFDNNVMTSLANYAFRTPLMAFDVDTFTDAEGIIRDWSDRAVGRRIIKDNYTVELPDPDTVSAAVRASGIATFNNVYDAELNSAIDSWKIQGTWKVGGV